jgi:chromosome segregation ATPase
VRKRLIDAFAQYDTAARRVRDLPTKSTAQQKLQANVYQQAMNFLSLHMLPLRSLPKILKHASPQANGRVASPGPVAVDGRPRLNGIHSPRPSSSTLATLKAQDAAETSSTLSSASAELSAMEAEEKELRERLIVLEEQKFFVSEMLAEANKHRKFEEVKALAGNVEDLSKEIDHIQGQLGQLDFAGAYQNTRPG